MARHTVGGHGRRRAGSRLALAGAASLLLAGAAAADEPSTLRCRLEDARGVPEADARTAVGILCEAIRVETGGRGDFSSSFATLGKVVVVVATRVEPPGSVTARLEGLEELPVAAPRIAAALVRGEPFVQTQRVDNLLADETRLARTKKGSVKFTLGVADVESVGWGARAAGFSLGLAYATPAFALPAELRFAWNDARYGEDDLGLFSISVGARRYLSKRDVSPFVGGGLGLLNLTIAGGDWDSPESFYGERFGVAPYVEAGVEMLRLHRGRVALQVRADFPTGSVVSESYYWDPARRDHVVETQSRYVVPVTVGLAVAF
jgi:hypothetical protein